MKRRAPSRGSSWLSLWGAALMSSYIGVFLATFPALSTTDDTIDTFNFTQTGLLVFPVLLYSSLVVGAREHLSIRTRPTRRSTIAYALLVAAFIALLALRITGTQYPWWVMLTPTENRAKNAN
jgi:hypothetical protein